MEYRLVIKFRKSRDGKKWDGGHNGCVEKSYKDV